MRVIVYSIVCCVVVVSFVQSSEKKYRIEQEPLFSVKQEDAAAGSDQRSREVFGLYSPHVQHDHSEPSREFFGIYDSQKVYPQRRKKKSQPIRKSHTFEAQIQQIQDQQKQGNLHDDEILFGEDDENSCEQTLDTQSIEANFFKQSAEQERQSLPQEPDQTSEQVQQSEQSYESMYQFSAMFILLLNEDPVRCAYQHSDGTVTELDGRTVYSQTALDEDQYLVLSGFGLYTAHQKGGKND